MKTTIFNYIRIVSICFIAFISCNKKEPCKEAEPYTRYIPEESRNKVPYQNFAELTFIDSATQDTHVFIGKGWNSTFWNYIDFPNECTRRQNLEKFYQNFYSKTYPDPIAFSIEYTHPCCEYIVVSVGKSIFYLYPPRLRSPYSFDSIVILNKVYFNVEYFKNEFQPQLSNKFGCFFNSTHGVLKIELQNGTLELINFKNP